MPKDKEALILDTLPAHFIEQHRLLPSDNTAAQAFEQSAQAITKELLGSEYNPDQITFMLSGGKEVSAFVMQVKNKPIIVLSRGLIEVANSTDEIAAVIAHELGHEYVKDKLGNHITSKGEEAFADGRAVFMLREAGYRQDAMKTLLQKLPEGEVSVFTTLTDEHPNKDMRIRLAENVEKYIDFDALEGKGPQKIDATPKPMHLMQELPQAVFLRPAEKFLADYNFDSKDAPEQMDIVRRLISQFTPWHDGERGYYINDILDAIPRINADLNNPAHQQSFDQLIDSIVDVPSAREPIKLYAAAQEMWLGEKLEQTIPSKTPNGEARVKPKYLPFGKLKELETAMQDFITAETAEEAGKTADRLNPLGEKYLARDIASYFDWPEFDVPDLTTVTQAINDALPNDKAKAVKAKALTPPWDNHVQWAIEEGITKPNADRINSPEPSRRRRTSRFDRFGGDSDDSMDNPFENGWTIDNPLDGFAEENSKKVDANEDIVEADKSSMEEIDKNPWDFADNDPVSYEYKQEELDRQWEHEVNDQIKRGDLGRFNQYHARNWIETEYPTKIAEAMRHTLLIDKRLESLAYEQGFEQRRWRGSDDGGWKYDSHHRFDQDPDGRLLGKQGSIHTRGSRETVASLETRQKDAEKILASDNWKHDLEHIKLERDSNYDPDPYFIIEDTGEGFIGKYGDQLMPIVNKLYTFGETNPNEVHGAEFATEFCNHLRVLLQNDTDGQYKEFAKEFFKSKLPELEKRAVEIAVKAENGRSNYHDYSTYADSYRYPAEHPFVQFAVENPDGVLPESTRIKLLERTKYFLLADELRALRPESDNPIPYKGTEYREGWSIDPEQALSLRPIESFADLATLRPPPQYKNEYSSSDEGRIEGANNSKFFRDRNRYHITQFLKSHPEGPQTPQEMETVLHFYKLDDKANIKHPEFKRLIAEHAEKYIAGQLASGLTVDVLVDNYRRYAHIGESEWHSKTDVFDVNPTLRRPYEEAIAAELGNVTDAEKRRDLAHNLFEKQSKLSNPEFRDVVVNAYVSAQTELIGKETSENTAQVRELVDHIMEQTKGDVRMAMLTRLADKLETQQESSFYIRDQLKDATFRQVIDSYFKEAIGEAGLDYFSRDDKLRSATLEYLTSPINDDNIAQFQVAVADFRERNNHDTAVRIGFSLGDDRMSEHQRYEQMKSIHENFWSFPFNARQLVLEKVLFPVHHTTQESFDENMRYAMDKAFPTSNKDSQVGREIIEAFLEVSDPAEKRLLLSAMLVGAEPDPSGKAASVGKALTQLKAFGPAGDKLLQAIHSHPSTPEHIRAEIGDSKSNSQWVPRWKLFEWLNEFGPDTNPDNPKTVRVGKRLGVGAYGATAELEKQTGDCTACTLLKPSADSLAEVMFDKFERAAEILIARRPELAPVGEMIRQANRASKVETDMSVAADQAKVAAQNYNGTKVNVNGREFNFRTAEWIGSGQRYKETEIIPGEHFNDLAADTPEAKQFKQDAAVAQLTAELYLRLSGKAVDHDRHGAQQRIEGNTIGVFDHGGQAVEAPNTEQKRLLAEVITKALKSHIGVLGLNKKPLGQALTDSIKEAGTTPERREYLAELQRDILALGDFAKELNGLDQKQLVQIKDAIFQTGDVDPVVMQEMNKQLGLAGRLALWATSNKTPSITLTSSPRVLTETQVIKPLNIEVVENQDKAVKNTNVLNSARQAAIERIQYLTEELQKRGISVMMRGELEFFPLNEQGKPEARLIDEQKLTEQLRKTVPTIDRVHHEIASSQAQYEMVTGPNPEMPTSGIEIDAPLRTAETMAVFKEAMIANAERLGLGGVSFDARNQVGNTHENSGMHINISLWDKDSKQNLFYEKGSPTTDLQRHVIDAMIHMHANAAPAYFPTEASFDRIRSTSQTNIGNAQSIEDTASGVPNTAGYMPNKGMTVGSVAQKAVSALTGNKVEIGSVTSRYSDAEAMLFGAGEKILFNGVRSSAIGWEKPEQYRIESRLAGADADPYMVIAAELAAIHEAVTKHTRPFDPAKPINPETEKVITVGDTQMVVDKHDGKFASIPLAMDMETARARMASEQTTATTQGQSLAECLLKDCKKEWGGRRVLDPHAENLLHTGEYGNHANKLLSKRTPQIQELEALFKSAGLHSFTYLGGGQDTLALGAIDQNGNAVAIRIGGRMDFPESKHMLQPISAGIIANRSVVIVEQATLDVKPHEAAKLIGQAYQEGYTLPDIAPSNIGRTKDGRIVVIDPGGIAKAASVEELEKGYHWSLNQLAKDTSVSVEELTSIANRAATTVSINQTRQASGAPKEKNTGTAQNNESNPSLNQSVETAALLATQLKSDTDKKSNEISDKIKQALETAESPVRHPESRGKSSVLLGTPEHRPNTVDFSSKGIGAAGLANRMNAIKEGKMGADEAATQGTAILADTIDVASDMRLGDKLKALSNTGATSKSGQLLSKLNISTTVGNRAGWIGNALGIFADTYSGYKKGGITEAGYQGTKSTINTGVSLALFLDKGKNLVGKGPAVGGVAGFAGKMGLINSFSTAAGDAMDYASGRKELNLDNTTATSLNTVVNLDPLKAVTSLAGATKLVGIDTGLQHVSISSIVDKGLGTVGLTEGKGEQIGDVVAETMAMYDAEKTRFKAGELDPSLRRNGSSPIPAMTDYKHLGALRHQIARYIPEGKIDGHDVSLDFDKIDMTKQENYMAYKMGINRMINEHEKIKIANSSYVPRWMRYGGKATKYNEAESQLNLLSAAEKEFGMFETKMNTYKSKQEVLMAEQKRYETAFQGAIASLDKNKDGNIDVNELNLVTSGSSTNTLDQEDLKKLREKLAGYGEEVTVNLEKALLESGIKFDGSTQIVLSSQHTPATRATEDRLAAK